MAQGKVTLNEIMTAVRELTFDRFIIPAFAIKQMGEGYYVDIDKTFIPVKDTDTDIDEDGGESEGGDTIVEGGEENGIDNDIEASPETRSIEETEEETENTIKGKLSIYRLTGESDEETGNPIKETIVELAFNDYPTLEDIMDALIDSGVVVAYTPYFRGKESATSLIQVKSKELTDDFTAFRRYFFSNDEIQQTIEWYYYRVLDIMDVELTDDIVGRLKRPSEKHLALWVSYHLVDKRRLYENAANAIGQTFTDGSDYSGSSVNMAGMVTSVQIGSVFNVTEDPHTGYFYEDFNRVGSDNTWGDRYSFWYKLMLYLRDLLETQFGDYSLRKNNVIPGYISLQRELDFRSYYDSYPFTLSPLSRGILSKTP